MNQRWRLLALWLLPIGVVLLIGWQVVSNGGINGLSQDSNGTTVAPRNAAVARMSYGRFLDYVEAGRVTCLLYTSPSPRDMRRSRMPSSA